MLGLSKAGSWNGLMVVSALCSENVLSSAPEPLPSTRPFPMLASISPEICVAFDLSCSLTETKALSSPPSSHPEMKVSYNKISH